MAVISRIANAGGDFTTVTAWESWAQGQFGATPDEYIAECVNDFPGDVADKVTIRDWGATDATNHPTVRPEAGSEHNGVFDSSFVITETRHTFTISQNYTRLEGIQITTHTGNFAGVRGIDLTGGLTGVVIRNMLIKLGTSTNRLDGLYVTSPATIENVVVESENQTATNDHSVLATTTSSGVTFSNVTLISRNGAGTNRGFRTNAPSGDAVNQTYLNCVSYGHGTEDWHTVISGNSDLQSCASGDTTVGGTNPLTGVVEADFTDFTNRDYVPASGNQLDGANNPGLDLSGTFTDDVAGNLRSVPWERGAYEIVGAGPSPIEVQLTQAAEVDSALAWGAQNPNAVQLTQSDEVDTALPWVIGGVYFNGPDIVSQTGVQNQVFTFNENGEGTVDSRFTPATTTYLLSPDSGPLPAGLSVNATTGNLEGTPTEVGTFSNIIIRGSDGQTGFSPEVQAVLTRMSSLSQTEIDAIEAFVDGLVADGIWQNLDEFYCFALNATDWLTGWKAFTATTSGNVTRTANGASCNNDESHIDTGIDLSTLTHYQATDCGIGAFFYFVPSATTFNRDFWGVSDATSTVRWRHRGSDTNDSQCTLNGTMTITVPHPVPVNTGFGSMDDDGVNARAYVDAVQQGIDTTEGIIPSGQNCYIFRWNNNGTPDRPSITGTVVTDFYIGAQVNLTQLLARLNTLHTALGVT